MLRTQQVWALCRLPLVLLAAYLLREPFIDLIERSFDIVGITLFAIDVLSTPVSRVAVALSLVAMLFACTAAVSKAGGRYPTILLAVFGSSVLVVLFFWTRSPAWALALVLAIFVANLLPVSLLEATPATRRLSSFFIRAAAGFAELLVLKHYLSWVAGLFGWQRLRAWARSEVPSAWAPAIVLASLAAALLLRGDRLVWLEQSLRSGKQVVTLAKGDFNWIELTTDGRHLYATGHGVPRLRRYDLQAADLPYQEADTNTGGAQSFAYDSAANELYIYRSADGVLLYLDAQTLRQKRAVPLRDLAPGDPWIVVDRDTDILVVVSEADVRRGHAFIALRRADGQILDRRMEDPGNVLLHEGESRLYLSYFRRASGVRTYDLRTLQLGPLRPADGRADRMALYRDQLLLASPLRSRIARYDAGTLAPLGDTPAGFGVRVMAVDLQRDLVVYGSLVTGLVHVADGGTGRIRSSHYLGPWLRTIALDTERGLAYVSSNGSLFRLDYAHEN